jgi:hypothetical protein
MKNPKKKQPPERSEFVDVEGKKWIQTSMDDLFSTKEINEILESIEKEKDPGEVVLARIDFQKVNREYYDRVMDLETRIKKKNELLKRLLADAGQSIEKKNMKLRELIEYIKKLHTLIAIYRNEPEKIGALAPSPVPVRAETTETLPGANAEEFAEVEETVLDDGGHEQKKAR